MIGWRNRMAHVSRRLKRPISMGYVTPEFEKAGSAVSVDVRGKQIPMEVTKMPFVPPKYYKAP